MRIYIRTKEGRSFMIPAPLWIVKGVLRLGNVGLLIGKRYMPEDKRMYVENIDLRELRKGFDVLKHYKGLTLVDIESSDGTAVKIII